MRRPSATYAVGLPIALLVLAPFLYMVATALLGEGDTLRRLHWETFPAALATLVVLALADQWKSFFWPLVATSSPDMQVLEVGIAHLHGAYDLNWPYQMAAATTAVIPMVVLYFVAQKYFLRGVEALSSHC